jgi:hypothetical protein
MPRQVHGSAEAADAARQLVAWGDLVLLVWRVVRRPVMWLLVAMGVLWGEWSEVYHTHVCPASSVALG